MNENQKRDVEGIQRATYTGLLATVTRMRKALAGISLVSQRNDSPSHMLVREMGKMARAALAQPDGKE